MTDLSDIDWSQWEPLSDASDPRDLVEACSFIVVQQPLHANHFVRTIRRTENCWEILCACGASYTVTWKPVPIG